MQYDSITLFTISVPAFNQVLSICIFSTPKIFVSILLRLEVVCVNKKRFRRKVGDCLLSKKHDYIG
ncbi:transmembrane protein, putative [Medicago truncatula]|uniref:Transmembrane protein, putative n=1 Tax=Medicago truncatula TaxID=3880 RepID=A0A072UEQ2_MEDTR|nr:transmembrane protein, putative [Medicago truncatula]